jgi:hypothetical protein
MINNKASPTSLIPRGVCINVIEQVGGRLGGSPGYPVGEQMGGKKGTFIKAVFS